jgi:hypothetical protein
MIEIVDSSMFPIIYVQHTERVSKARLKVSGWVRFQNTRTIVFECFARSLADTGRAHRTDGVSHVSLQLRMVPWQPAPSRAWIDFSIPNVTPLRDLGVYYLEPFE